MTGTRLKNNLDAADICTIIEACAKFGVSKLSFADLHVHLGPQSDVPKIEPHSSTNDAAMSDVVASPEAAISEEKHKKFTEEAIVYSELETREDQLDNMIIENPSEYERLMTEGELEDADDEPRDEQ